MGIPKDHFIYTNYPSKNAAKINTMYMPKYSVYEQIINKLALKPETTYINSTEGIPIKRTVAAPINPYIMHKINGIIINTRYGTKRQVQIMLNQQPVYPEKEVKMTLVSPWTIND